MIKIIGGGHSAKFQQFRVHRVNYMIFYFVEFAPFNRLSISYTCTFFFTLLISDYKKKVCLMNCALERVPSYSFFNQSVGVTNIDSLDIKQCVSINRLESDTLRRCHFLFQKVQIWNEQVLTVVQYHYGLWARSFD